MSFPTKIEQDQKARSAEYGRAREEGLAAIFAAFPGAPRHMANEQMVEEICAHFLGLQLHQCTPTLAVFRSAVAADPTILGKVVSVMPIEKQKAELIDEICDLLRSPDGSGRGGKYSDFNLKSVRQQMQYWEISKLQVRRNDILRSQTLVQIPLAELKQGVAEAHRVDRPFPGWPTLPSHIVPPGQIQAVVVDADYLNRLIQADTYFFKRLVNKYGSPQIDARRGLKK
jgi:hypothetical protein